MHDQRPDPRAPRDPFPRVCAGLLALTVSLAPEAAGAAPPSDAATTEARALYTQGQKHYALAEYREAIALFKKAYHLTSAPELLFNIAQAYRLTGACEPAVEFYRSFLRTLPMSPKREAAEGFVVELQSCPGAAPHPLAGEQVPLPPPVTALPMEGAAAPNQAPSGIPAAWSWGLGGASIVAGGIGTAFLISARADHAAIARTGCAPSCDPGLVEGPRARQTTAVILLGGAALLGLSVLTLWIVEL